MLEMMLISSGLRIMPLILMQVYIDLLENSPYGDSLRKRNTVKM
jgi:hypothetical protein